MDDYRVYLSATCSTGFVIEAASLDEAWVIARAKVASGNFTPEEDRDWDYKIEDVEMIPD